MTPSKLTARLPTLLSQVKAGNNSEKLKNVYEHYMKTIFMNTKNSKTNESNRFRLSLTDKLNVENNKTIALANLSIFTLGKM